MSIKKKGELFFIRLVSAIVLVTFTVTNTVVAAPAGASQFAVRSSQIAELRLISPDLGSVEEKYVGKSDKTVYYIQDAHDSLEAQENIAKIITSLVEKQNVKTVFEEGYEGVLPTQEFFGFMQNSKAREMVSYFLLDKLRIGAAEYAHINRAQDFKLIGADSIELQLENIDWAKKNAENQKQTAKDLAEIAKNLQKLSDKYFPKALKEQLKLRERFDSKQLGLADYLLRIMQLAARSSQFGNELLTANDKLRASYPHLAIVTQYLNKTTLTQAESKELETKLKTIDAKTLFQEIEQFEQEFVDQCFANAARSSQSAVRSKNELLTANCELLTKIYQYSKTIALLQRLNNLEVTQEEYEAVMSRRSQLAARSSDSKNELRTANDELQLLSTQTLADFIAKNTGKPVLLSKEWEENLKSAIAFYETAKKRDSAISASLETFAKNSKEKVSVLVYGGFHKEAIKEILKKQGFSYVVISPRITKEDPEHRDYYKRLLTVGYHEYEIPAALRSAARELSAYTLALKAGKEAVVDYFEQLYRRAVEISKSRNSIYATFATAFEKVALPLRLLASLAASNGVTLRVQTTAGLLTDTSAKAGKSLGAAKRKEPSAQTGLGPDAAGVAQARDLRKALKASSGTLQQIGGLASNKEIESLLSASSLTSIKNMLDKEWFKKKEILVKNSDLYTVQKEVWEIVRQMKSSSAGKDIFSFPGGRRGFMRTTALALAAFVGGSMAVAGFIQKEEQGDSGEPVKAKKNELWLDQLPQPTLESHRQMMHAIADWLRINGYPRMDVVDDYVKYFDQDNAVNTQADSFGVPTLGKVKFIQTDQEQIVVNLRGQNNIYLIAQQTDSQSVFIELVAAGIIREAWGFKIMQHSAVLPKQKDKDLNKLAADFHTSVVTEEEAVDYLIKNQGQIEDLISKQLAFEFYEEKKQLDFLIWAEKAGFYSPSIAEKIIGMLTQDYKIQLKGRTSYFNRNDDFELFASLFITFVELWTKAVKQKLFHTVPPRVWMFYLSLQQAHYARTQGKEGMSPATAQAFRDGSIQPHASLIKEQARALYPQVNRWVQKLEEKVGEAPDTRGTAKTEGKSLGGKEEMAAMLKEADLSFASLKELTLNPQACRFADGLGSAANKTDYLLYELRMQKTIPIENGGLNIGRVTIERGDHDKAGTKWIEVRVYSGLKFAPSLMSFRLNNLNGLRSYDTGGLADWKVKPAIDALKKAISEATIETQDWVFELNGVSAGDISERFGTVAKAAQKYSLNAFFEILKTGQKIDAKEVANTSLSRSFDTGTRFILHVEDKGNIDEVQKLIEEITEILTRGGFASVDSRGFSLGIQERLFVLHDVGVRNFNSTMFEKFQRVAEAVQNYPENIYLEVLKEGQRANAKYALEMVTLPGLFPEKELKLQVEETGNPADAQKIMKDVTDILTVNNFATVITKASSLGKKEVRGNAGLGGVDPNAPTREMKKPGWVENYSRKIVESIKPATKGVPGTGSFLVDWFLLPLMFDLGFMSLCKKLGFSDFVSRAERSRVCYILKNEPTGALDPFPLFFESSIGKYVMYFPDLSTNEPSFIIFSRDEALAEAALMGAMVRMQKRKDAEKIFVSIARRYTDQTLEQQVGRIQKKYGLNRMLSYYAAAEGTDLDQAAKLWRDLFNDRKISMEAAQYLAIFHSNDSARVFAYVDQRNPEGLASRFNVTVQRAKEVLVYSYDKLERDYFIAAALSSGASLGARETREEILAGHEEQLKFWQAKYKKAVENQAPLAELKFISREMSHFEELIRLTTASMQSSAIGLGSKQSSGASLGTTRDEARKLIDPEIEKLEKELLKLNEEHSKALLKAFYSGEQDAQQEVDILKKRIRAAQKKIQEFQEIAHDVVKPGWVTKTPSVIVGAILRQEARYTDLGIVMTMLKPEEFQQLEIQKKITARLYDIIQRLTSGGRNLNLVIGRISGVLAAINFTIRGEMKLEGMSWEEIGEGFAERFKKEWMASLTTAILPYEGKRRMAVKGLNPSAFAAVLKTVIEEARNEPSLITGSEAFQDIYPVLRYAPDWLDAVKKLFNRVDALAYRYQGVDPAVRGQILKALKKRDEMAPFSEVVSTYLENVPDRLEAKEDLIQIAIRLEGILGEPLLSPPISESTPAPLEGLANTSKLGTFSDASLGIVPSAQAYALAREMLGVNGELSVLKERGKYEKYRTRLGREVLIPELIREEVIQFLNMKHPYILQANPLNAGLIAQCFTVVGVSLYTMIPPERTAINLRLAREMNYLKPFHLIPRPHLSEPDLQGPAILQLYDALIRSVGKQGNVQLKYKEYVAIEDLIGALGLSVQKVPETADEKPYVIVSWDQVEKAKKAELILRNLAVKLETAEEAEKMLPMTHEETVETIMVLARTLIPRGSMDRSRSVNTAESAPLPDYLFQSTTGVNLGIYVHPDHYDVRKIDLKTAGFMWTDIHSQKDSKAYQELQALLTQRGVKAGASLGSSYTAGDKSIEEWFKPHDYFVDPQAVVASILAGIKKNGKHYRELTDDRGNEFNVLYGGRVVKDWLILMTGLRMGKARLMYLDVAAWKWDPTLDPQKRAFCVEKKIEKFPKRSKRKLALANEGLLDHLEQSLLKENLNLGGALERLTSDLLTVKVEDEVDAWTTIDKMNTKSFPDWLAEFGSWQYDSILPKVKSALEADQTFFDEGTHPPLMSIIHFLSIAVIKDKLIAMRGFRTKGRDFEALVEGALAEKYHDLRLEVGVWPWNKDLNAAMKAPAEMITVFPMLKSRSREGFAESPAVYMKQLASYMGHEDAASAIAMLKDSLKLQARGKSMGAKEILSSNKIIANYAAFESLITKLQPEDLSQPETQTRIAEKLREIIEHLISGGRDVNLVIERVAGVLAAINCTVRGEKPVGSWEEIGKRLGFIERFKTDEKWRDALKKDVFPYEGMNERVVVIELNQPAFAEVLKTVVTEARHKASFAVGASLGTRKSSGAGDFSNKRREYPFVEHVGSTPVGKKVERAGESFPFPNDPGVVGRAERPGQEWLLRNPPKLPVKGTRGRESEWEAMGVQLGEVIPEKPLFRRVTLPEGWRIVKRDSDLPRWSDLVDKEGKVRAEIWYASAIQEPQAFVRFPSSGASLGTWWGDMKIAEMRVEKEERHGLFDLPTQIRVKLRNDSASAKQLPNEFRFEERTIVRLNSSAQDDEISYAIMSGPGNVALTIHLLLDEHGSIRGLQLDSLTEDFSTYGVTSWIRAQKIWTSQAVKQFGAQISEQASSLETKKPAVYVTDKEMRYSEQTIAITPTEFTVRLPAYVGRFLRHLNPHHPLVTSTDPEYQKAIQQDMEKGTRVSLIHEIPREQLDSSTNYQELMRRLKNTKAFMNEKIALSSPLHFTLIGGLEGKEESPRSWLAEASRKLSGRAAIPILVKGPWASNFIRGRAFLRVYPAEDKKTVDSNQIAELIKDLGGKDFRIYAVPLFQLKDDLTGEEAAELQTIFNEFKDKTIFEYSVSVKDLNLASFKNDLLEDMQNLGNITALSLGAKDENAGTSAPAIINDENKITEKDLEQQAITFIMLKPDVFSGDLMKGILEELERLEKKQEFKILFRGAQRKVPRKDILLFYKEHLGKTFYRGLVRYIESGNVIPIILRGNKQAYQQFRNILGKDSKQPGTLRALFESQPGIFRGKKVIMNRIHASDSFPSVLRETFIMLDDSEIAHIFSRDAILKMIELVVSASDPKSLLGGLTPKEKGYFLPKLRHAFALAGLTLPLSAPRKAPESPAAEGSGKGVDSRGDQQKPLTISWKQNGDVKVLIVGTKEIEIINKRLLIAGLGAAQSLDGLIPPGVTFKDEAGDAITIGYWNEDTMVAQESVNLTDPEAIVEALQKMIARAKGASLGATQEILQANQELVKRFTVDEEKVRFYVLKEVEKLYEMGLSRYSIVNGINTALSDRADYAKKFMRFKAVVDSFVLSQQIDKIEKWRKQVIWDNEGLINRLEHVDWGSRISRVDWVRHEVGLAVHTLFYKKGLSGAIVQTLNDGIKSQENTMKTVADFQRAVKSIAEKAVGVKGASQDILEANKELVERFRVDKEAVQFHILKAVEPLYEIGLSHDAIVSGINTAIRDRADDARQFSRFKAVVNSFVDRQKTIKQVMENKKLINTLDYIEWESKLSRDWMRNEIELAISTIYKKGLSGEKIVKMLDDGLASQENTIKTTDDFRSAVKDIVDRATAGASLGVKKSAWPEELFARIDRRLTNLQEEKRSSKTRNPPLQDPAVIQMLEQEMQMLTDYRELLLADSQSLVPITDSDTKIVPNEITVERKGDITIVTIDKKNILKADSRDVLVNVLQNARKEGLFPKRVMFLANQTDDLRKTYPDEVRMHDGTGGKRFIADWRNAKAMKEALEGVISTAIRSELGDKRIAELREEIARMGLRLRRLEEEREKLAGQPTLVKSRVLLPLINDEIKMLVSQRDQLKSELQAPTSDKNQVGKSLGREDLIKRAVAQYLLEVAARHPEEGTLHSEDSAVWNSILGDDILPADVDEFMDFVNDLHDVAQKQLKQERYPFTIRNGVLAARMLRILTEKTPVFEATDLEALDERTVYHLLAGLQKITKLPVAERSDAQKEICAKFRVKKPGVHYVLDRRYLGRDITEPVLHLAANQSEASELKWFDPKIFLGVSKDNRFMIALPSGIYLLDKDGNARLLITANAENSTASSLGAAPTEQDRREAREDLDHFEPANVFIHGADYFEQFSDEQRYEIFSLSQRGSNKENLNIIVYGTAHQPPEWLEGIDNIHFTHLDAEAAKKEHGKPKANNLFYCLTESVPEALVEAVGDNRFKVLDNKTVGLLSVGLLYAEAVNKRAFKEKWGLEQVGEYFSIVGKALGEIVQGRLASLVTGKAA